MLSIARAPSSCNKANFFPSCEERKRRLLSLSKSRRPSPVGTPSRLQGSYPSIRWAVKGRNVLCTLEFLDSKVPLTLASQWIDRCRPPWSIVDHAVMIHSWFTQAYGLQSATEHSQRYIVQYFHRQQLCNINFNLLSRSADGSFLLFSVFLFCVAFRTLHFEHVCAAVRGQIKKRRKNRRRQICESLPESYLQSKSLVLEPPIHTLCSSSTVDSWQVSTLAKKKKKKKKKCQKKRKKS